MFTLPDLHEHRILVTGANSGIGLEATRALAAAGAEVVMAVRNRGRGDAVRREIVAKVPHARLEVRTFDLADLDSIHACAREFLADGKPLHGLLNNAGVMMPPARQLTADGFELQFGCNVLGHVALTNLLLPKLLESPAPRVATVTSAAAWSSRIAFNDLQSERTYRPWASYAQSKLGDLLIGLHLGVLAERHGWNLTSTIAHPGIVRTNLWSSGPTLGTSRSGTPWYFRLLPAMSARVGAEPILRAIADPDARQGTFYGPRFLFYGPSREIANPPTADREQAAHLWRVAEDLTGTRVPT